MSAHAITVLGKINCVLEPWTNWSQCSSGCGGGTTYRTRAIKTYPQNGGTKCGLTYEQQNCNQQPCPINCVVGPWNNSECSVACGEGLINRTRTVLVQPNSTGKSCPPLYDQISCEKPECQCEVSHWEDSQCSAECGGGIRIRTRSITKPGAECPDLYKTESCNQQPCPQDCVVSEWITSECSAGCGGGLQARTRSVTTLPIGNGKSCPPLRDYVNCNQQECPQDCIVGEWRNGQCSAECGGGVMTRTRQILAKNNISGRECPVTTDQVPCNQQECPQDCVVSDWTANGCSAECGGGHQQRTREILQKNNKYGRPCPPLSDYVNCNQQVCPKDCVVSDWIKGECSAKCGGGIRQNNRNIISSPIGGGKTCPELITTEACNPQACPQDCVLSSWSDFSACSQPCNGGVMSRSRNVLQINNQQGKSCGNLSETISCNDQECPKDCAVSHWSTWSTCSQECGDTPGTQSRSRQILQVPNTSGLACPPLQEQAACNDTPCPIDCQVGAWSSFGECVDNFQERTRSIIKTPNITGKPCPVLKDTQHCAQSQSSINNCVVSAWTPWSDCSTLCGGGKTSRSRTILQNGLDCPNTFEEKTCNNQACVVKCKLSPDWTYTPCSASCGGGIQQRSKQILVNGKDCADYGQISADGWYVFETVPCNQAECSYDCQIEYGNWSSCSTKNINNCGSGKQYMSGRLLQAPVGSGKLCEPPAGYQFNNSTLLNNIPIDYNLTRDCQNFPCATNCQNGGTWNPATSTCSCLTNFSGSYCEKGKCQNGGTWNSATSACSCLANFSGTFCENAQCQNGGTWNPTTKSCSCPANFGGTFCEQNKCQNGSTWNPAAGACSCLANFTGTYCETAQCKNGGKWNSTTKSCSCLTNFTGGWCETGKCQYSGTWNPSTNACSCLPNFTGAFCEKGQCQNGGTWNSATKTCTCPVVFSGTFCEQNKCQNGATVSGGKCVCPALFSGNLCQTPMCKNGSTIVNGKCACPATKKVGTTCTTVSGTYCDKVTTKKC